MKKLSFSDIATRLQNVVVRFPLTLIFIAALAVLFFIDINVHDSDIPQRLWVMSLLGIPLSLMVTVFSENFEKILIRVVLQSGALILLVLHVLFLPEKLISINIGQTIVLGVSALIAVLVVPFFKKDDAVSFWEFSKTIAVQVVTTVVFAGIFMLGLSLAAFSLDQLFKIDIQDKVYANLAVFCFALFAPVYFLSNIPAGADKYKTEYKFDKFLKILGLYIFLPILSIYTVILYAYLVQIVAQWELPNGWVTWLVSVLALGGFVTMFILYPLRLQKQKVALFFSRYFPVILFPLLILMTIGIFRRFDDYGLTIKRAYVFLLNFWLYGISVYLFITRSKSLKWIVFTFVVIAVLASVGPWSVFDVTKRTLLADVQAIFEKNNYLQDGKMKSLEAVKKIKLSPALNDSVAAKVDYLIDYYGVLVLQPLFSEKIDTLGKYEVLDRLHLDKINTFLGSRYFSVQAKEKNYSLEIKSYSQFIKIALVDDGLVRDNDIDYDVEFVNETQTLVVKDKSGKKTVANIPLKGKLEKIMSMDEPGELPLADLTIVSEHYKLIIESMSVRKQMDRLVEVNHADFILFLK